MPPRFSIALSFSNALAKPKDFKNEGNWDRLERCGINHGSSKVSIAKEHGILALSATFVVSSCSQNGMKKLGYKQILVHTSFNNHLTTYSPQGNVVEDFVWAEKAITQFAEFVRLAISPQIWDQQLMVWLEEKH